MKPAGTTSADRVDGISLDGVGRRPVIGFALVWALMVLIGGVESFSGSKLTEAVAGTNHWAYQKVRNQPPPKPRDVDWVRSPIDAFILHGLEQRGLVPAPDSDRQTLCRRIYFDLTGLPPTPEQLAEFAGDTRVDALDRLVDRLLASPRFGEHWGRHWLDVSRYAESVTLRGLIFKEAWRYRNYVIEMFNEDQPFDEFVRDQIAGDLIHRTNLKARQRGLVATTFLMLGNTNLEEQDKKQLEMDFVDEQLDVIGKAFLGQTLGCARCHDHKFDPIPTRDYYAMAGILKGVDAFRHDNVSLWAEFPLPLEPELEARLRSHEAEVARVEGEIKRLKQRHDSGGASGAAASTSVAGVLVDSAQARRVGDWMLSQAQKPFFGDGYLHDRDAGKGEKTLTFQPELPAPGRYEVRLAYTAGANRADRVPITVFHADGETVVYVNQQQPPGVDGRFVPLGIYRFEASGFSHVLVSNDGTRGHVIADAVQFVSVDATSPPSKLVQTGGEARILGTGAPDAAASEIKTLEAKLRQLKASGLRRPMVMAARDGTNIQDIAVHRRGSVHSLGEVIPRGVLSVVPARPAFVPGASESGRRELAEWLTSSENPLTSRVLANRIWHWLMGEGLVRSVDQFGTTGDSPSHRELLDWLALRLSGRDELPEGSERGWSLKRLVRDIVTSRTYRMSSRAGTDAAMIDPENRLWSHANRRRLTAEQLRDSVLVVSGALRLEPNEGPGFPIERTADYDHVSTQPVRSIFLPAFRNAPNEMLTVFDAANPSMVVGRRERSTVVSQALFLLNNEFVREQSVLAAERWMNRGSPSGQSWRRRIESAFESTLGRGPGKDELRWAESLFQGKGESVETWADCFHALFGSIGFRYAQ